LTLMLGYKASAEQFGPRELLDFSCYAEEVGFDSVFVSDHFQPWRHTGGHAPFSFAWLGALGARTSRIKMGTSVLTPSFRYHPSIVAQAFGTLGALFEDRMILGIGTGESLNEVPATGMAWPEMKERFARMREAVTLIRQLWTEERVSFHGEYYKTERPRFTIARRSRFQSMWQQPALRLPSMRDVPATASSARAARRASSIPRRCFRTWQLASRQAAVLRMPSTE